MTPRERMLSCVAVLLGIAASLGIWFAVTDAASPAWAGARYADEGEADWFARAQDDATVRFLGEELPAPDWSRADFSSWQQQQQQQQQQQAPPVAVDTPVGPLNSTGDNGQPHGGSTCSTAGAPGQNGNCSTDGRGVPGSPQVENCSASDSNGATSCSSGGGAGSKVVHCSAGGPGTGSEGRSAACSTGGTGLQGKTPTKDGTCSATQKDGGSENVDCSVYDGGGGGGTGTTHLSCSVGNSTTGSCSAKKGGDTATGKAFCSVSGDAEGSETTFGNKCSVSGYPNPPPAGTTGQQKCSVLVVDETPSNTTCSVKAGETAKGACTVVQHGNGPMGSPGECSTGNSAPGVEPEVVVCSVVNKDGSVTKPTKGLCGEPHKH